MSISITYPGVRQAAAVAVDGTGRGRMCVVGTMSNPNLSLPASSISANYTVKVEIFKNLLTTLPDPDAAATGPLTPQSGQWSSDNVTVPAGYWSSGPPFPPLTVVAYLLDGTGTIVDRTGVQCCGRTAATTDCGTGVYIPCGSGSGSGPMMLAGGGGGASAAVVLAPARWRLPISEFLDPLHASFNGDWLLSLRDSPLADGVWDNRGDGNGTPCIELRCEPPPGASWRLRLHHGPVVLEYTAAAGWEALRPLALLADVPAPLPRSLTALPV